MNIPKPLATVYLIVSAILSLLGLAGVVDQWVSWTGFFRDVLDLYIYYVRDSIALVINAIKPAFLPEIPDVVYDLIVIWTCCFVVFRIFVSLEKDHRYIISLADEERFFYTKIFLWGPFAPYFLWSFQTGRIGYERERTSREIDEAKAKGDLNEEGKIALLKRADAVKHWSRTLSRVTLSLLVYYAGAALLIVVLAFINYQILLM